MNDEIQATPTSEDELRKQAVSSIKRKRAFKQTLVAYVLVNAFLIGIWAVTGAGFFWPVFPLLGWGIGLGFQAWGAYGHRHDVSEDQVAREMDRLRR
jgi:hypothetical protein